MAYGSDRPIAKYQVYQLMQHIDAIATYSAASSFIKLRLPHFYMEAHSIQCLPLFFCVRKTRPHGRGW